MLYFGFACFLCLLPSSAKHMWKTVSPAGAILKNVDLDNENVEHTVNEKQR